MLSTDRKGSIAEIAIAEAAIRLGVDVYKPLNDGTRCDLIFDLAGRLTRVQCKWAARYGEVLIVRCARNRRTREGLLSRRYTIDEVDAFAAYSMDLDCCYFLPSQLCAERAAIGPSRNNQQKGINWAERFEFGATLGISGAVAQLGERQSGTLKAAGSSPAGSTKVTRPNP